MLPPGFFFEANGCCLLEHYPVPRALHGHCVPDEHGARRGIADGVDVYAVRPEALPFPNRNRGVSLGDAVVWGYFYAKRPAAAGPGVGGGDDTRLVAAGWFWLRYGRKKVYVGLDKTAPAFRGVTFHPSAKDLVILKVYFEAEIPDEEPVVEYYSSDDNEKEVTVGDAIAVPGAIAV